MNTGTGTKSSIFATPATTRNNGRALGIGGSIFTPLLRKPSTYNTNQPQGDSEKEWTSARCNRLLRALTSRVAVLRTDLSRLQKATSQRNHGDDLKPAAPRVSKYMQDPEWKYGQKTLKTYSGRGGRRKRGAGFCGGRPVQSGRENRVLIPGDFLVPTPILNRARGDLQEVHQVVGPSEHAEDVIQPRLDPRSKKRSRKDGEGYAQLSELMREVKRTVPPSRYSTYDGIFNGVEALFIATASDWPESKTSGARSLFTTCLRAVPAYIADEEEAMATQKNGSKSAINRKDVSTEIYDDLEAFGTSGRGWRHLKTIVRSHGIQVICDAIAEGLFDLEFVSALVALCIFMKATAEAQSLLSSLLNATVFPEPKSTYTRFCESTATRPLSMFQQFSEQRDCVAFQYREIQALVDTGSLPLAWLSAKEFSPIWSRAIHDLSFESTRTPPLLFMKCMLSNLAQIPNRVDVSVMSDATKQTFSSLLTTLLSISILGQEPAIKNQSGNALNSRSHGHIREALRSSLVQWDISCTQNTQGALLLLANVIAHGNESHEIKNDLVDRLLNYVQQRNNVLSTEIELVAFLCSVARCCGRGTSTSGFEHLQQSHTLLTSIAKDRALVEQCILHELIVDSAFAFAQQLPGRQHLEYATRMESKFHIVKTKNAIDSTPRHSSGFRWEEGISEWVSATPAPLRDFLISNVNESETPLRPHKRRNLENRAKVTSPAKFSISSQYESNTSSPLSTILRLGEASEYTQARLSRSDGFCSQMLSCSDKRGTLLARLGKAVSNSSCIEGDQDIHYSEAELGELSLCAHSKYSDSSRQHICQPACASRSVPQKSVQIQLLDSESEDELSFCSTTSSQVEEILRDITSTAQQTFPNQKSTRPTAKRNRQKSNFVTKISSELEGSEDELCA